MTVLSLSHNRRVVDLVRWGMIAVLVVISIWLTFFGLEWRRQVWANTSTIRYEGDVEHGYGWGQIGKRLGIFNVYDLFASGQIRFYPNELDYTPLRLAIVTL